MAYYHGADFLDRIQRYLKPVWDKEEWLWLVNRPFFITSHQRY